MTREFAIIAPSPPLSPGADGRGEVAFTVTHVTGPLTRRAWKSR